MRTNWWWAMVILAMAAFIVHRSELLKYPELQNDVSGLCTEVVTSGNELLFTPKPGSIANVGMVFMFNHIACRLLLDARVLESMKNMSFEESLSKETSKKQRSIEPASNNNSPVIYAHPM